MQDALLARNPSAQVRVYAIWLPMLFGDSRSAWPADVLPDPRVTHLWDEKKVAGRWFSERVEGRPGVAWDAYFLYGGQAKWNATPSPLVSSGSPVISRRSELQRSLLNQLKSD